MNIRERSRFITRLHLVLFSLLLPTINSMQPDEISLQGQFHAALNQIDWADRVDSFTTALAQGEESITHSPSQAIQSSALSTLNTLYQGRAGQSSDDLQTLQFLLQKAPQSAFIPKNSGSTIQGYLSTINNEIALAQSRENSNPSQPEIYVPQEPRQAQPAQSTQVQQIPVQQPSSQIPSTQPVRSFSPIPQISSQQIDVEIQQAMANPTTLQKIDGITVVLNKYSNVLPQSQTQNNFATALQTLFDQRYASITQTAQQTKIKKNKSAKNKTKKQKIGKKLKKSKTKKMAKMKNVKATSNKIKQPKPKHKKQKKQTTI